jgi:hypothetical protein
MANWDFAGERPPTPFFVSADPKGVEAFCFVGHLQVLLLKGLQRGACKDCGGDGNAAGRVKESGGLRAEVSEGEGGRSSISNSRTA